MSNITLKFQFKDGVSTLYKDVPKEDCEKIFTALQDSRHDCILIGSQWINKNGLLTVFPEVANEESSGLSFINGEDPEDVAV